jgi:hypothetical protein
MATDKHTTITVKEVLALADRLSARADSRLLAGTPEMQSDMRMAARCLQAMARHFNSAEPVALNGNGGGQ